MLVKMGHSLNVNRRLNSKATDIGYEVNELGTRVHL